MSGWYRPGIVYKSRTSDLPPPNLNTSSHPQLQAFHRHPNQLSLSHHYITRLLPYPYILTTSLPIQIPTHHGCHRQVHRRCCSRSSRTRPKHTWVHSRDRLIREQQSRLCDWMCPPGWRSVGSRRGQSPGQSQQVLRHRCRRRQRPNLPTRQRLPQVQGTGLLLEGS